MGSRVHPFYFASVWADGRDLPAWQHPISLRGQRLYTRKLYALCPCVLRALCQDLRSLTRAGVGIGGPLRPAAFEYLGGRYVIMFRAANEFWRPPKAR